MQNTNATYILASVKGYEDWNCSIVKTTDGKTAGFIIQNRNGKFAAIYQPKGRVPAKSMLGIAERNTKEECAEIIIKTYVNRYSRFITI